MSKYKTYLKNILLALDQLGNVILGGNNPDETISSAVGRKAMKGVKWALIAEKPINFIFELLGEKNHCRNKIEWDEIPKG